MLIHANCPLHFRTQHVELDWSWWVAGRLSRSTLYTTKSRRRPLAAGQATQLVATQHLTRANHANRTYKSHFHTLDIAA